MEVSPHVYRGKRSIGRGKGKEEGVWRAQKIGSVGLTLVMGQDKQKEARPLTVETAVFRVRYLIKLLLI